MIMGKGTKIIRTQNIIRKGKEINVLILEDNWISENDILYDKYNNIYNILFYDTIEDIFWDKKLKTYKRFKRSCIKVDNKIKDNILYVK